MVKITASRCAALIFTISIIGSQSVLAGESSGYRVIAGEKRHATTEKYAINAAYEAAFSAASQYCRDRQWDYAKRLDPLGPGCVKKRDLGVDGYECFAKISFECRSY